MVKIMKKLVFLFAFLLVSCAPSYQTGKTPIRDAPTVSYTVIDGMPCIVRDNGYQGGITCDWSQWNGQVINGQVVIGE